MLPYASERRKVKEAALYSAAAKWQKIVVEVLLGQVQYPQELLNTLSCVCGYKVTSSMDEGCQYTTRASTIPIDSILWSA